MKQSRLLNFKSLFLAVWLLVTLGLGAEVLLGIVADEPGTEEVGDASHYAGSLPLSMSDSSHHRLTPFATAKAGEIEWSVNSLGLRGPEVEIPKPPNTLRIVCLGDEFVLGSRYETSATFCSNLQKDLASQTSLRVEVINAGVPGYCPLLSYLQYRNDLGHIGADLIICVIEPGDIADDHRIRRLARMSATDVPLACAYPRRKRARSSQPWWAKLNIVRYLRGKSSHLLKSNPGGDLDDSAGRFAFLKPESEFPAAAMTRTISPLSSLRQLGRQTYAQMVAVAAPLPWQVSSEASQGSQLLSRYSLESDTRYDAHGFLKALKEYTTEHKIPFLDATRGIRGYQTPTELFEDDRIALTARGNQVFARVVAQFVVARMPGVWKKP